MENAASTVAMFSPPMSPFHTEFYNHLHRSIFDLQDMDMHLYSMQEIVSEVDVEHADSHGQTTLNLMEKILGHIEGLEMSSKSVKHLHQFMAIVNYVKDDMIPDLYIEHNQHAVLFAEEDSTSVQGCA